MPKPRHPFDGYSFGCRYPADFAIPKTHGPAQVIEQVEPPVNGSHHYTLRVGSREPFTFQTLNRTVRAEIAKIFEMLPPHYWPVVFREEGTDLSQSRKTLTLRVYRQGPELYQPDVITLGEFKKRLQVVGAKVNTKVNTMLRLKRYFTLMSPLTEKNATAEQSEILVPYLVRDLKSKGLGSTLSLDTASGVIAELGVFKPEDWFFVAQVFMGVFKQK